MSQGVRLAGLDVSSYVGVSEELKFVKDLLVNCNSYYEDRTPPPQSIPN